jgi:endonuclease VIII
MPEGPQMYYLKEQLDMLVGQTLKSAGGDAPDIPFDKLSGAMLTEIRTFGKELLFCFESFTLRVHLMLFGKYAVNDTLPRKLRLGLEFEEDDVNFYASSCKYIGGRPDNHYHWPSDLMNPAFDAAEAVNRLVKKPGALICDALLNQDILAGAGNKIKNEILHIRRVHPRSRVGEIPPSRLRELVDEAVRLSFRYLEWQRAGEENDWKIYKRKECSRDGTTVTKEEIGGRSCYFCERCQELFGEG